MNYNYKQHDQTFLIFVVYILVVSIFFGSVFYLINGAVSSIDTSNIAEDIGIFIGNIQNGIDSVKTK